MAVIYFKDSILRKLFLVFERLDIRTDTEGREKTTYTYYMDKK